jgi:hypothetical protein
MNTILIILGLLVVAAGVYYFGFYNQGKINDRDGDFIPDEVEDAVEDVKQKVEDIKEDVEKTVKEVKRRAKRVKEEVKDVVDAAKEVVNQAGDVVDAVKGSPRRGRKTRRSNNNN